MVCMRIKEKKSIFKQYNILSFPHLFPSYSKNENENF